MNDQLMLALQLLSQRGGAPSDMQTLLDQQSASNPALGMMLKQLSEQQARIAPPELDIDARELRLERGRRRLEDLCDELEQLRARNDQLAAALGACAMCWGAAAACPECRGRGVPGHFQLDRGEFARWVAPVLRRSSAQSSAKRSVPADLNDSSVEANTKENTQ